MKVFKKKKPRHIKISKVVNDDSSSEAGDADMSFISFDPPISSTQKIKFDNGDGSGIKASSYHDDGQPSYPPDAHTDILRVMDLIQQERHLAAYTLYLHTIQTIETHLKFQRDSFGQELGSDNSDSDSDSLYSYSEKNSATTTTQEDQFNVQPAQSFLSDPQNAQILQKLQQHAQIFHRAKRNATRDDNWIPSTQVHGIASSYRHEEDGSLSLKVEGEILGLPLFEQVAVMRELDLYHTWAPVCSKSKKICSLGGKLDTVGWLEVGTPVLSRDACYRAIGCDCMNEDGCVIVVAQGLHDNDEDDKDSEKNNPPLIDNLNHAGWTGAFTMTNKKQKQNDGDNSVASSIRSDDMHHLNHIHNHLDKSKSDLDPYIDTNYLAREAIMESIQLPPKPKGFNTGRMNLKFFEAVIEISSPTTANTRLVANLDPQIRFLPKWMLDYIMKQMCGIILLKMQHAAKKATLNSDSHHAQRMKEDNAFYKEWLLPKFESYCNKMGWELPSVNALSDIDRDDDMNETLSPRPIAMSGTLTTKHIALDDSPKRETNQTNATHDETASTRSKFSHKWNKKIRNLRIGKLSRRSDRSVQSAPITSPDSREYQRMTNHFSEEQQKRLDALKQFKLLLDSKDPPNSPDPGVQPPSAEREPENHPYVAAITHLISDYSKAVTLSLLFTLMLFAYHAVPYDFIYSSEGLLQLLHISAHLEGPTQFFISLLLLSSFCCLHWAVIEAILVSAFDTIELPVIRRHFDDSSSNMRLYFMQQTRLPTILFSGSLAFSAILKNISVLMLRETISYIRWALGDVNNRCFDATFSEVIGQILQDSRILMTYTAVFVLVCYLFVRVSNPKKEASKGSYKDSHLQILSIRSNEETT